MALRYRITNWVEYQHYKDRNPPWIKLHYELLTSRDWVTLDDASRVLAIACMLVASRSGGEIDGSAAGMDYLQRVAYLNTPPDLSPLIDSGFLTPLADASTPLAGASTMLAKRIFCDTETETETEEETEVEVEGGPGGGLTPSPPPDGGGAASPPSAPLDGSGQRTLLPEVRAPDPEPLAAYPAVAAFYPELRRILLAANQRARLPDLGSKAELDDRATLARLLRREAYDPDRWVSCMRWLFESDHKDAEFWRKQVQSFRPLGEVKKGASKMAKIYAAWEAAEKGSVRGRRIKFEVHEGWETRDAL